MLSSKAFILAAGLGTRMRPLTDERPKPLLEVEGKSLLDRTLDHLQAAQIREVVINTHYKAQQISACLKDRKSPKIHVSHEDILLDTGGGIKKALSCFEDDFFVLSGDGLWENSGEFNALKALAKVWNPDKMDILMLLQPVERMILTQGVGDYDLDEQGRAVRSKSKTGKYMFTSIRINAPRIFEDTPEGPFSYLKLMDRAQEAGRLYGLVHQGDWHHISTPVDLAAVDAFYTARQGRTG